MKEDRDTASPYFAFGQIRKSCLLLDGEVVLCSSAQLGEQRLGWLLATVCLLSVVPLCKAWLAYCPCSSEWTEEEYALSSGPLLVCDLWRETFLSGGYIIIFFYII